MANTCARQGPQRLSAIDLTRSAEKLMFSLGYATMVEFRLRSGYRIDLAALDAKGQFSFVEVKSSVADFRCDQKWHKYLEYCDQFYFCVSVSFPLELLERPESQPGKCGIIITDRFGGEIVRQAAMRPLHASRRRSQIIRFAHRAGERLFQLRETKV